MLNPNFLTINLIPLLVAFITVYFLSFYLYPIMATNSLTTFQGPIYENSQINSTINPNSHSGSQSNFVNDSSLVSYKIIPARI